MRSATGILPNGPVPPSTALLPPARCGVGVDGMAGAPEGAVRRAVLRPRDHAELARVWSDLAGRGTEGLRSKGGSFREFSFGVTYPIRIEFLGF